MLALAVRQAARAGAEVVVVDPRPVRLPCAHLHIPVEPAAHSRSVGPLPAHGRFRRRSHRRRSPLPRGAPARTRGGPGGPCARPPTACPRPGGRSSSAGPRSASPGLVHLAADAALLLQAAQQTRRPLLRAARRERGRGRHAPDRRRAVRAVLQAAADGSVQALVVVESDPLGSVPGPRPGRGGPRAGGTRDRDRLPRLGQLAPCQDPAAIPDDLRSRRRLRQPGGSGAGNPAHLRRRGPHPETGAGIHPPAGLRAGVARSRPEAGRVDSSGLAGGSRNRRS